MYSWIMCYIRKANLIEKTMPIIVKFDEDEIYINVKCKSI